MTDSVFLSSDLSILKSEYKRDQFAYFVKKTQIYILKIIKPLYLICFHLDQLDLTCNLQTAKCSMLYFLTYTNILIRVYVFVKHICAYVVWYDMVAIYMRCNYNISSHYISFY